MRKLTAFLCMICIVLLTGCGKNREVEVGTPENPYKLVWYTFGTEPNDFTKVQDKANTYLKDKIGVELEMKFLGVDKYSEKMQIIEASGEVYDLSFTCSWANDYRLAAKKGYITPIDNLLQKYGQGILKVLNPAFLEGTKIDGKNYAVPVNKEIASQHVYKFNKKYVDKYNFDISKIKSIKDLEPMFKTIQEKELEITPFAPLNYYMFSNIDFVLEPTIPGAVMIEKGNHKVINQYETKEFKERMKWFRKYYLAGYIPKDAAQRTGIDQALIRSGKWFCTMDGYQPGADRIWSRELGFPVVSVPVFAPPVVGTVSVAGAMIGISSTSEHPEIAMKFLNLLNTDKHLRNLIGYGIEDVHFKKTGENSIEFLPASSDYFMMQFVIGNLFITHLLPGEPEDKWEKFEEWNASSVKSPILGFAFDTNPVKIELSSLQNIVQEFSRELFLGTRDPETDLPKMIEKMKDSGLDKVLAEMQKQVNEWWSKK